jgi:TonB family protein
MRLSWFFIASIAFHGALALIHYSPAATSDEEIAPVQLYLEPTKITTANAIVSSGVTKNRSRQVQRLKRTRLPDPQAIATSAPGSNSARQIAEEPSDNATRVETQGEKLAVSGEPAEHVSATMTTTSNGTEAARLAVVTATSTGESARSEEEPADERFSRAEYVYHPKPDYPKRARREGWEGTVLLEVLIDSQGRPERVAINRSSGFAVLDHAAREAVESWRFRPASLGTRQIASTARVPIVFRLDAKN